MRASHACIFPPIIMCTRHGSSRYFRAHDANGLHKNCVAVSGNSNVINRTLQLLLHSVRESTHYTYGDYSKISRSLRQSYTAKFPSAAILICVFLCYLRISDTRITIWKLSLINILWAKFWAFATNVSQNIKRVRNCTFSIVIRCKTYDDSIKLIVSLILNLSRVVLDVPLAICLTS